MNRRILLNSRLYGAGGIETHLLHLCQLLVQQGAEVTLVSRFAHGQTPLLQIQQGIPIRVIATPFAQNLRYYRFSTWWAYTFWRLTLQRQFDLLYTLEIGEFMRFLTRFVRPNGMVLYNKLGPLPPPQKNLEGSGWELIDHIVTETPMQAEALRQKLHQRIPITAIPHIGHVYGELPARTCSSHNDIVRIAYLGRYAEGKGIERLLALWPTLDIQPARLDFYGYGSETTKMETDIHRLGLGASVHIHSGWQDVHRLSEILAETDLLILLSESEGLPLILLEAMAHGVPFVATDVGAIRTLAEDNPDVRVVPPENRIITTAIKEMVQLIRMGQLNSKRLQAYHDKHYRYQLLAERWTDTLLYSTKAHSSQSQKNEQHKPHVSQNSKSR